MAHEYTLEEIEKKACQAEVILFLAKASNDSYRIELATELAADLIGSVVCWLLEESAQRKAAQTGN